MTIDLDKMKEVAKAATPGPWNRDGHHMSRVLRCTAERGTTEAKHLCGDFIEVADAGENWMVDAPFIATFDPPTVLALIDRLEVAEAQRDLWEDERNKWAGEAIARMDDARTLRADLAEAVEALRPFSATAVHDIGDDEADADKFRPCTHHNRAPILTVGDLRKAAGLVAKHDVAAS